MKTKMFPLNVVLTVTTGRLLTTSNNPGDNGIGQLYEILNWITDDNLYTHQLARVAKECKPFLFEQFIELESVGVLWLDVLDALMKKHEAKKGIELWIDELKIKIPELKNEYNIPQMPKDKHEIKDPILEAEDMIKND